MTLNSRLFSRVSILAGSLALILGSFSCNNKHKENELTLTSYTYDTVAEVTHPDSLATGEGRYWHCVGQGVLPVALGDSDIHLLRDSLEALGRVEFAGEGKATPRYGEDLKGTELDPEKQDAGSFMVNQLSIDLMTPQVVVWRSYLQSYIYGSAHGRYQTRFVNFSLANNKILTLSDIFKPGYEKPLLEMLKEKVGENPEVFKDAEITIPQNFRITDNGVAFLYGLYEIAPYSAGEVEADFAFYELTDLLKPSSTLLILGETVSD